MKKLVSLVAPFYNESGNVLEFFRRVASIADSLPQYRFEVIAVNDGSRDNTWAELLEAKERYPWTHLVDLSRNFGKENALTAGLDRAKGDAVVPIDADLQHPPELLEQMLAQWEQGAEVVLARRTDRQSDGKLQKLSAVSFYRFHNKISNVQVPMDVGDFRLMDRRVVEALHKLPENHRFMKGLFAWVGFRTVTIPYVHANRHAGVSSFNAWKLWNLALEGITSFSTAPLKVWTYVGLSVSALALLYGIVIVGRTMIHGIDVPGYASLMASGMFLGGIQLIGIGVLGEYVGRIYHEVKRRPVYLVREEHAHEAS
ncbi:bactoprenol glucosyl transferase [Massilia sp. WF1]|uniref:glycosyltransferase family 2 protein n=1 Tax=unclassified Massilia TaxID=2609279 RepID=UPI000649A598|nr:MULTISPECIES: glycosyltransferase family 2 protein [unclassified Massilia]ALK98775.1 bactoprenol glucosyl transferase [Massilia sp. WG5]KLU38678.1 bactoprenol glucosyl transferase [Massilia sp. WF1]